MSPVLLCPVGFMARNNPFNQLSCNILFMIQIFCGARYLDHGDSTWLYD